MITNVNIIKIFLNKFKFGKKIIGYISNFRYILNIFFFKFCKFFRIFFSNKKYKSLGALKNKFLNKRCFIVATGPSMKIKYLKYLKNEFTFSMNNIVNYFGETEWRPTFYVIQDKEALNKNIQNLKKEKNLKVLINYKIHKLYNKKNKIIFPHYNGLHGSRMDNKFITSKFSKNASIEVFDGYTVTYSIMQIAYYFGFKKIYLIGVDNYFENPNWHDFDPCINVNNKKQYKDYYRTWNIRMLNAYKCAKKWSKKLDFEIISIDNSKLNIFRKKKFHTLFKKTF
jgi:hypothetical protein